MHIETITSGRNNGNTDAILTESGRYPTQGTDRWEITPRESARRTDSGDMHSIDRRTNDNYGLHCPAVCLHDTSRPDSRRGDMSIHKGTRQPGSTHINLNLIHAAYEQVPRACGYAEHSFRVIPRQNRKLTQRMLQQKARHSNMHNMQTRGRTRRTPRGQLPPIFRELVAGNVQSVPQQYWVNRRKP